MAAARPALVTSVGGHVDLIRHGETGALLPLAELDHLPEAIEELLDLSTNERAKLGRAARDYVLRHHAGAAESASYGRLYAQARGRGPLVSKSSA
jgi:glycosyltransferase involved in cell wall biosynthesis